MFSQPSKPDRNFEEGTVVQVDVQSSICKVRTLRGQMLQAVAWLTPTGNSGRGGDRTTPHVGDRVVVFFGLGHSVILGTLPRIQGEEGSAPINIHDGTGAASTGSYGPSTVMVGDQNKPTDLIQGDRVLVSAGAALIATLRGGSVLLRASRTAEILMNKMLGLVRVFSSNWEHFSDVSSDVIKNWQGRIYRYIGYANTFADAKIENYHLHHYYGDTAAAEAIKTNYYLYSGTPPVISPIISKEQITGSSEQELMRRTLDLSGNEEVYITNGTHFTRQNSGPEQLTLSWNDSNTVTINQTEIQLNWGGVNTVTITTDSIVLSKNGQNVVTIDANVINLVQKDGSTVLLNSTGITATKGAGELLVSDGSCSLSNNGHAVTVTSGGVSFS